MLKPDSRLINGCVIVLTLSAFTGYSFDGGGHIQISPYSSKEAITATRVSTKKDLARKSMTAKYVMNGADETLSAVGLDWIKKGRVNGRTAYKLTGSTDSGPLEVDFSEIEQLSILKTEALGSKVRAFFKVVAFPNVSAEQLVNERPTYSELREKYSKTLELWVDIKTNAAGNLCFVGKQAAPRTVADFKNDVVMKFEMAGLTPDDRRPGCWKGNGEGIWWAIPSVIADTNYPYKRVPMKS